MSVTPEELNLGKQYLMLQRRAFLQSISADERLLNNLKALDDHENKSFLILARLVAKNAEERRKAFLQIVRDIEKRYGLKSKKRRKANV